MTNEQINAIGNLVTKAPKEWLSCTCELLRRAPTTANSEFVVTRLPSTNNADLAQLAREVIRSAASVMSWEALSFTLLHLSIAHVRWSKEHRTELLWSGPAPEEQIPARRIDQALYDRIAEAKREVLLVTFAATKISRLAAVLWAATGRGVRIRLILEFEEASEGQLSFDALNAFPQTLRNAVEVYFWPTEERERNQAGYPGKLHAKLAVIDDTLLVSSANLTDDAFTRNLEVGVAVNDSQCVKSTVAHFEALISLGVLRRRS